MKNSQNLLISGINGGRSDTLTVMKGDKRGIVKRMMLVASGVGIGVLNGLLGGGGGMIAVPVLRHFCGLPTKKAHATAIAVMLPLSVASAVVYTLGGVYEVQVGILSAASVTLGGAMGALALSRLNRIAVAILFFAVMTAAGVQSVVRWFG